MRSTSASNTPARAAGSKAERSQRLEGRFAEPYQGGFHRPVHIVGAAAENSDERTNRAGIACVAERSHRVQGDTLVRMVQRSNQWLDRTRPDPSQCLCSRFLPHAVLVFEGGEEWLHCRRPEGGQRRDQALAFFSVRVPVLMCEAVQQLSYTLPGRVSVRGHCGQCAHGGSPDLLVVITREGLQRLLGAPVSQQPERLRGGLTHGSVWVSQCLDQRLHGREITDLGQCCHSGLPQHPVRLVKQSKK
jgi:hypothetical protein